MALICLSCVFCFCLSSFRVMCTLSPGSLYCVFWFTPFIWQNQKSNRSRFITLCLAWVSLCIKTLIDVLTWVSICIKSLRNSKTLYNYFEDNEYLQWRYNNYISVNWWLYIATKLQINKNKYMWSAKCWPQTIKQYA